MTSEKNLIVDGQLTFWGGVDSGIDPSKIEPDKASYAVNSRMRGGILTHRPPFAKLSLDFGGDAILETRFSQRFFQNALLYQPDSGPEYILCSIGGRQFRVNVGTDNSVQEITVTLSVLSSGMFTVPAVGAAQNLVVVDTSQLSVGATVKFHDSNYTITAIVDATTVTLENLDDNEGDMVPFNTPLFFYDVNPATNPRAWSVQAEKYWILQNGENLPLIYDGASMRRARSNLTVAEGKEIPIGTIMEYGRGRILVALPNRRKFAVGDLVGSSSGTVANQYRDAVLKFTQNTYLGTGRNFAVPQTSGGITAMRAIPDLDGALNQGPVVVFTPTIAFTVQLPYDATTWADLTNPVQTVALIANGARSQNATNLINGDIWYRSTDGWRSLVLARRDFNTWANTPVSAEMNRALAADDETLLEFASSAFFDGRELMTVSPERSVYGNFHYGLIALDLNRISGLRDKLPPAYDGLWTGLNVLQLVTGIVNNVERCFAFSVDESGAVELFEILKEGDFDSVGTEEKIRITWSFESRVFRGANPSQRGAGVFDLKRLENGELWLDEVFGRVDMKVWFRPVGHPCWYVWRENINVCADTKTCSDLPLGTCQSWEELKPQDRPRIQFGAPPDDCNYAADRPAHTAEGFQVRVEFQGQCRLRMLRVFMRPIDEPMRGATC